MRALFAATVACSVTVAIADDPDYGVLGVQYISPDGGRGASHGAGGSAAYGHEFNPTLALEGLLRASVLEPDADGAASLGQQGAGLDLRFSMGPAFLIAGAGVIRNDDNTSQADAGGYFNAGVGWRSAPTALGLRYRAELRAVNDAFAGGQLDVLAGLAVELHRRASPMPVALAPAAPPSVIRLEMPPVVADADGDGVPDESDRCARTLTGATVAEDGCVWQEQVVTMSNLKFPSNSARLTPEIAERLDSVAAFFANQPDVAMGIHGHTDAQGSDAFNQKLSSARAASVRDYLIRQGIAPKRLESQGFGESQPIADNETEEGRAQNRRVDLRIRARQPR
ncbi:MAG TPA: OmpA family protein [Verrucomicrobiae bacterium]|nr:OmpA family protein [Verrucomicrobiae bacterium]